MKKICLGIGKKSFRQRASEENREWVKRAIIQSFIKGLDDFIEWEEETEGEGVTTRGKVTLLVPGEEGEV